VLSIPQAPYAHREKHHNGRSDACGGNQTRNQSRPRRWVALAEERLRFGLLRAIINESKHGRGPDFAPHLACNTLGGMCVTAHMVPHPCWNVRYGTYGAARLPEIGSSRSRCYVVPRAEIPLGES
jgi:hypothetical protein